MRAWVLKEAAAQGRHLNREIGDDVYNACANMFIELPERGNTYATLWRLALRMARGAGLRDRLDVGALTPDTLEAVARILDEVFFRGSFGRYIARKAGRVAFGIMEGPDPNEPDAAMFHDRVGNRIVLVRPTWRRRMPDTHAEIDGVAVKSKLEWLMRMMAHELCHCLASMACSRSCELRARNHGPVFERLSHSIFGHPGEHPGKKRRGRS